MFSTTNIFALALTTLAATVLSVPTYDPSTGSYGAGCPVQEYTSLQPGYKFYCRDPVSGNDVSGTPSVHCDGDVVCENVVCACPEGTQNAILNDSNGWYVATCAAPSA